jgi:hypothetical protein
MMPNISTISRACMPLSYRCCKIKTMKQPSQKQGKKEMKTPKHLPYSGCKRMSLVILQKMERNWQDIKKQKVIEKGWWLMLLWFVCLFVFYFKAHRYNLLHDLQFILVSRKKSRCSYQKSNLRPLGWQPSAFTLLAILSLTLHWELRKANKLNVKFNASRNCRNSIIKNNNLGQCLRNFFEQSWDCIPLERFPLFWYIELVVLKMISTKSVSFSIQFCWW